ncbi:MAG: preprotein translocase subunit YajC [Nevskiales bacterium]
MDFLISSAWAQTGAAPASNPLIQILPLIALLVLFYFMLIRPQMKRAKEHRELLGKLGKGDEVVTNGGLAGKVRDVGETFVLIEIANNVQVKLQKGSVSSVLPKGTLEHL